MPKTSRSWVSAPQIGLLGCLLAALGLLGCLPDRFSDAELDQKTANAVKLASCRMQASCALASGCAGDKTCQAACSAGAASAVVTRVNAVVDCRASCVTKWCPGATGSSLAECENNCLAYQCAGEMLACATPTATGSSTCLDLFPCLAGCAQPVVTDGVACVAKCSDLLASAELNVTTGLANCLSASGKAGTKASDACTSEFAGCYAGGVTGASLCHEAFGCLEACAKTGKAESACTRECMAKLTNTAQTQFVTYLQCVDDNNGQFQPCKPSMIACADPQGTAPCSKMFEDTKKCLQVNGTSASGSCVATALRSGKPQAAMPYLDLLTCYSTDCAQVCEKTPAQCNICLTTKCGAKQGACTKS